MPAFKEHVNDENLFVNLPYEIHLNILSYAIDPNYNFNIKYTTRIQQLLNVQTTCKKLMYEEDDTSFNEFYFKLLENYLPIKLNNEKIKEQLIKKTNLKRIVSLTLYIKFNQLKYLDLGGDCIKVVMLGAGGVGKSSITIRFTQNTFTGGYYPSYYDDYRKDIELDGRIFRLDIIDTCGQDEYSAMRDQYMRFGQCFIIVCDVSRFSSIEESKVIVEQLIRVRDSEDIPIIFALNKMDLVDDNKEIEICKNEVISIIKTYELTNANIFVCSAKTGTGIENVFEEGIKLIRFGNQTNLNGILQQVIEKDVKYLKSFQKKKQNCILN